MSRGRDSVNYRAWYEIYFFLRPLRQAQVARQNSLALAAETFLAEQSEKGDTQKKGNHYFSLTVLPKGGPAIEL